MEKEEIIRTDQISLAEIVSNPLFEKYVREAAKKTYAEDKEFSYDINYQIDREQSFTKEEIDSLLPPRMPVFSPIKRGSDTNTGNKELDQLEIEIWNASSEFKKNNPFSNISEAFGSERFWNHLKELDNIRRKSDKHMFKIDERFSSAGYLNMKLGDVHSHPYREVRDNVRNVFAKAVGMREIKSKLDGEFKDIFDKYLEIDSKEDDNFTEHNMTLAYMASPSLRDLKLSHRDRSSAIEDKQVPFHDFEGFEHKILYSSSDSKNFIVYPDKDNIYLTVYGTNDSFETLEESLRKDDKQAELFHYITKIHSSIGGKLEFPKGEDIPYFYKVMKWPLSDSNMAYLEDMKIDIEAKYAGSEDLSDLGFNSDI